MDKITTEQLYTCLNCKLSFASKRNRCPSCKSKRVIRDELFSAREGDDVYACVCENKFFKIARASNTQFYFVCINCGNKLTPRELGITDAKLPPSIVTLNPKPDPD